jgi:HTH domain
MRCLKIAKETQATRRERLGQSGLCRRCSKPCPPGRATCERCLQIQSAQRATMKVHRRAASLCACGRPVARESVFCSRCLRARKRDGRRCTLCGSRRHIRSTCPDRADSKRLSGAKIDGTQVRGRQLHQAMAAMLILRRGRWTIPELAAELDTHPRTAYRLIDALRRVGVIIEVSREREMERGTGAGYYTIPSEPLRKLLRL